MFKDVFQTERLIVKNIGITVRTLGYYFFEPLMFGFKIRFLLLLLKYLLSNLSGVWFIKTECGLLLL